MPVRKLLSRSLSSVPRDSLVSGVVALERSLPLLRARGAPRRTIARPRLATPSLAAPSRSSHLPLDSRRARPRADETVHRDGQPSKGEPAGVLPPRPSLTRRQRARSRRAAPVHQVHLPLRRRHRGRRSHDEGGPRRQRRGPRGDVAPRPERPRGLYHNHGGVRAVLRRARVERDGRRSESARPDLGRGAPGHRPRRARHGQTLHPRGGEAEGSFEERPPPLFSSPCGAARRLRCLA